jgi:hypothetical protein
MARRKKAVGTVLLQNGEEEFLSRRKSLECCATIQVVARLAKASWVVKCFSKLVGDVTNGQEVERGWEPCCERGRMNQFSI